MEVKTNDQRLVQSASTELIFTCATQTSLTRVFHPHQYGNVTAKMRTVHPKNNPLAISLCGLESLVGDFNPIGVMQPPPRDDQRKTSHQSKFGDGFLNINNDLPRSFKWRLTLDFSKSVANSLLRSNEHTQGTKSASPPITISSSGETCDERDAASD